MICTNCNYINNDGSTFCIKCGNRLIDFQNNNVQQNLQSTITQENLINNSLNQNIANQMNTNSVAHQSVSTNPNTLLNENTTVNTNNNGFNQPSNIENTNVENLSNINDNKSYSIAECIMLIIRYIIKPQSELKKEYKYLSVIKNSILITIISIIFLTVVDIVSLIINYSSYDGFGLDILSEIEYIETIGQSLLIYGGIILGISIIYYIAGMIIKKQHNFCRMLAITSIAIIPAILGSSIFMPLLGLINVELGMIILVISFIYSMLILYEGINEELKLEGNIKIYLNLICATILMIVGYKLFMYILMESMNDNLGNILDFIMY